MNILLTKHSATEDIQKNYGLINLKIKNVKNTIIITPESSLYDYTKLSKETLDKIDIKEYRKLEKKLSDTVKANNSILILGTITKTNKNEYKNSALICGDIKSQRYHKQKLMPADKKHFIAGDKNIFINHKGWKIGVTICFDIRFPELYKKALKQKPDLFINIAHMAGKDPNKIKQKIIPNIYSTRACETVTPVILCNTNNKDKWLQSNIWNMDGTKQNNLSFIKKAVKNDWFKFLRKEAEK